VGFGWKYTAAMAKDKGLSPGSMHRYNPHSAGTIRKAGIFKGWKKMKGLISEYRILTTVAVKYLPTLPTLNSDDRDQGCD
jgi:hypothetical protein